MAAAFYLCLSLLVLATVLVSSQPPVPAWPDRFTIQLKILVEKYGKDWSSKGVLYYDYGSETFRADYLDWCLPLFDSGNADNNNYTCTFLATQGSMYFVNHTSHAWQEYQCCLFEQGLAAVPPDWMKNCDYNGTTVIDNKPCDVWWFPGTSDPLKPCYGYWNARDDKRTPVKFFGLTSVGPTILEYSGFTPGKIPDNIPLGLPNAECKQECKPPLRAMMKTSMLRSIKKRVGWPWPWPTCE